MIIWLDDERPMPPRYTHHCKTAQEAIDLLLTGQVNEISLDHDLGDNKARADCNQQTGYDVACCIEQGAHDGSIPFLVATIHTANPVGRENIRMALIKAKEYWRQARFEQIQEAKE